MGWKRQNNGRGDSLTALSAGMEYLVNSARSICQMKEYLLKKGYDENEARSAIERLLELSYLDDRKFAALQCDAMLRHGKGTLAMKRDLANKGVDECIVDEAIREIDETQIAEMAVKLARKADLRYDAEDPSRYQKTIRYVLSRGFSVDHARKAAAAIRQ